MVVAIKSYTNFDMKGGEKALFYWGYGHFRVGRFTEHKICKTHSFTFYLQLAFEQKKRFYYDKKENQTEIR